MNEMKGRLMVDIETLGREPGCSILSVGAVRFDETGLGEDFYREISVSSCQDYGLTIDGETLEWWLGQDEKVKDVLTGGCPLEEALADFAEFYGDSSEIWAFSPSFDCDILHAAYDACDMSKPWHYREERCARTIASLEQSPYIERNGDHHNALDDAKHQALTVGRTLIEINT